jgi:isopropylmalate/isohomocitrate dehydrogenase-like protein
MIHIKFIIFITLLVVMRVGYLPGDGIGPEVLSSARAVLEALGPPIEFVEFKLGLGAYEETGEYLPKDTLEGLKDTECALMGAITSPPSDVQGYESIVPQLRRHFNLYANLRPAISILPPEKLPTGRSYDIVVVRENTEGLYIQREEVTPEGVIAQKVVTREASERICRYAFEHALTNGRKKVTGVHKGNVLRKSDGLFREVFLEVAKEYDLPYDECYVDAAAMFLVKEPERFDVIVTMNIYGDILSDLTAGLIGGMGYAPSGNIGDDFAIFEPVHGSAPDIAGQGIANPSAAILCGAMMLEYSGNAELGTRIRQALSAAITEGHLTKDVGGALDTQGFTKEVISRL